MPRSARHLALIQALRRRRRPVLAADLAAELGVSLRTIHRDVATLAAQGAPVEGEAGLGYVLARLLPAAVGVRRGRGGRGILGLRLVSQRDDAEDFDLIARALDAAPETPAMA